MTYREPTSDNPPTITKVYAIGPLRLSVLRPSDPRSRLWNEYIQRYHYLGHKPLPGAQLRYFVHADDGLLLALLGCGAAAWKTAPRDQFIGWDPPTRQRNLRLPVFVTFECQFLEGPDGLSGAGPGRIS